MSRLLALALALALTGCSCSDPSPSCTTDRECTDEEMCLDGACVPRLDAGPEMDGGAQADSGTAPDSGPRTDAGALVDAGDDTPDAICGGQSIEVEYTPPNVLLIFDRSCSMRRRLDDGDLFGTGPEDTRTRWNVAREAAIGLIDDFGNRAFWGLMAYPDPREGCGDPVDAEVPPAANTRDAIAVALSSNDIQPFGLCGLDNSDTTTQPRQTPTFDAMTAARALPALSSPDRASFAFVITDGGVSCGVEDAALSALASDMAAAGIPVGVIAFATSAQPSLDAIASSGGFANPNGPTSYFVAEDGAALQAVLDQIAERVVSCELALTVTPADPSRLFVITNDGELTRDPTDGWSYDAVTNTITLNGASCDALRRGDITRLDVGEGCAPMECVPRDETCNGLDDDCDDRVDEACLD